MKQHEQTVENRDQFGLLHQGHEGQMLEEDFLQQWESIEVVLLNQIDTTK